MGKFFLRALGIGLLVCTVLAVFFSFDVKTDSSLTDSSTSGTQQPKFQSDDSSTAQQAIPPSMPASDQSLQNSHSAGKDQLKAGTAVPESVIHTEGSSALVPEPQKDALAEQKAQDSTPQVAESAPLPQETASTDPPQVPDSEEVIKGTINKGDTVSKLLGEVADNNVVQSYIDATRRVFPLTAFRAGQPYVLVCDVESGSVKRFEYEIDRKRRLVVEGEQPTARVEAIEYDIKLALIETRIDDNLFQAVADMGESPVLALTIANLFGWEINFIRDLQEGDSFNVLLEKQYREGVFKGYGRVLGATFTNKGKTYEAFLFHNGQSSQQHFNAKGENLKKVLLQAPLSFTRLTSAFSKSRKHPIFGNRRPHLGVDYGAPTGTPVKAVGEGVVIVRGWVGGYGNQVALRHAAGLESMYSHLSGFARGLKKGSKVRQGQVIAYVGSTGQSTGPHLDFRLKQGGKFVDPTKAVNPRSAAVYKQYSRAFNERMKLVRGYLQGKTPLNSYDPDMIAAPADGKKG